jgi:hypothetical protein
MGSKAGIAPIHLREIPLKYWRMVPSQSGPLWLQSSRHHGRGGYLRNGGNNSVPRNSVHPIDEFEKEWLHVVISPKQWRQLPHRSL